MEMSEAKSLNDKVCEIGKPVLKYDKFYVKRQHEIYVTKNRKELFEALFCFFGLAIIGFLIYLISYSIM